MIICTRPIQGQAGQHSSLDGRGVHETMTLAEELLATGSCLGGESHFYRGVAAGRFLTLWQIHYTHVHSNWRHRNNLYESKTHLGNHQKGYRRVSLRKMHFLS